MEAAKNTRKTFMINPTKYKAPIDGYSARQQDIYIVFSWLMS